MADKTANYQYKQLYADEKMTHYFGTDRTLSRSRVEELLVSNSFGANSILYAVWLGYVMGMWAMLIHTAWCISFCLLSKFSKRVYAYASIHDFLAHHFGNRTKVIAAICSAVGLLYFTGWEISIAQNGLGDYALNYNFGNIKIWSVVMVVLIGITLSYTIMGGQQANGYVNLVMNRFKILLLIVITAGLLFILGTGGRIEAEVLMPNFHTAVKSLGVTGLITNILLNLSWQFVDNSSWQFVSYGYENDPNETGHLLRKASCKILCIYTLETLLGASLRCVSGLNSDNVLSGIIYIVQRNGDKFISFCVILLLMVSMMSLVDGMSLSVAQTIMIDLNLNRYIFNSRLGSHSCIQAARIVTFILGIFSAWGIQGILSCLGSSIFDFVYVFTIVQLGLIGPVLVGLIFKPKFVAKMGVSIVISVGMGLLCSIFGNGLHISWLADIAGTITIVLSCIVSCLVYHFTS